MLTSAVFFKKEGKDIFTDFLSIHLYLQKSKHVYENLKTK